MRFPVEKVLAVKNYYFVSAIHHVLASGEEVEKELKDAAEQVVQRNFSVLPNPHTLYS